MSRWSKGTLDHDGDGRPGGSRKGTDMTAKKKTATKKPDLEPRDNAMPTHDGTDQIDVKAQDGREARLATMEPDGDATRSAGQVATTSGE